MIFNNLLSQIADNKPTRVFRGVKQPYYTSEGEYLDTGLEILIGIFTQVPFHGCWS